MKTALLLAFATLLAPVAVLAAYGARRGSWPAALSAALLLAGLVMGVHAGLAW